MGLIWVRNQKYLGLWAWVLYIFGYLGIWVWVWVQNLDPNQKLPGTQAIMSGGQLLFLKDLFAILITVSNGLVLIMFNRFWLFLNKDCLYVILTYSAGKIADSHQILPNIISFNLKLPQITWFRLYNIR